MKQFKHILALAAAAGLLAALAGCGSRAQDATMYIQGELDASYKGTYVQEYLDLVEGMTAEDVEEQYDYWTEGEAEYLLDYLDVQYPDEEVLERAQDVVKAIYAQSKYEVTDAELLKSGDITSEVKVSPIELFHLMDDDLFTDTWDGVLSRAGIEDQDTLDALSEEEQTALESEYGMLMLDEVEKLIPQITYGQEQSVMLQMKKDEDGYFALVDTGVQKLDEIMIDYYGDYME